MIIYIGDQFEAVPEQERKDFTTYKCPCGEVYHSDIDYLHLYCLICGRYIPREEVKNEPDLR